MNRHFHMSGLKYELQVTGKNNATQSSAELPCYMNTVIWQLG